MRIACFAFCAVLSMSSASLGLYALVELFCALFGKEWSSVPDWLLTYCLCLIVCAGAWVLAEKAVPWQI